MPDIFDRDIVQQLIADIDKPQNGTILKIGYFLRVGQPELPTSEGFSLLKTAADAEPMGTRRWFLLQNLLAFAAFRVKGADTGDGFAAYNAMFTHAAEAVQSKAEYPLRQAITEFVAAVPGKFRNLGLNKDNRTRETLLKAWVAYVILLISPRTTKSRVAEPLWIDAIEEADVEESFVPIVEKVVADVSIPKTFGLLFTAASVMALRSPNEALSLLQEAKPLLPQEKGKLNLNQSALFYNSLIKLLVSSNRIADAINVQEEFVKLTGRGQSKLMLLYKKIGNHSEMRRIVTLLSNPSANEQEVNEAASELIKLSRDSEASDIQTGEWAEILLTSYLTAKRTRSLEEELSARLALANIYMSQQKMDLAKSILTISLNQEITSPRAHDLTYLIEQVRKRVNWQTPTLAKKN